VRIRTSNVSVPSPPLYKCATQVSYFTLEVYLLYFMLHTLGKILGSLQTISSQSISSLSHRYKVYESVAQCKSVVHGIKATQFNDFAKLFISFFSLEKGFFFVGEVLLRRNFPTTLMYLIIFRHTDRLVCAHAQSDGLIRRFFFQCMFKEGFGFGKISMFWTAFCVYLKLF